MTAVRKRSPFNVEPNAKTGQTMHHVRLSVEPDALRSVDHGDDEKEGNNAILPNSSSDKTRCKAEVSLYTDRRHPSASPPNIKRSRTSGVDSRL